MLTSAATFAKSLLPIASLLLAVGCRTTLKPVTNTVDTVAIEMQVIGLREIDQNRPELVYTLSNCGLANANGMKNENNVVLFQAEGVKKGDECDVRVETGKTDVGVANWNDEPGLMYVASRVKINSSEGKLSGIAFVQQKYVSPPTIPNTNTPAPAAMVWKIQLALAAPKALTDCTCTLHCVPEIVNNVAMLESAAGSALGRCEFANLVTPQAKTTECKRVSVQCGSEFFVGSLQANTLLDGSVAGQSSLPQVTLAPGIPEATSDATIEVVIPQN